MLLSVSMTRFTPTLIFIICLFACIFPQEKPLSVSGEKHLRNIKQLTFGGENAEAYFSSDGKQLIFQSKRDGRRCDQIYTMNSDGTDVKMVSSGEGRTTCSYFLKTKKAYFTHRPIWAAGIVRRT